MMGLLFEEAAKAWLFKCKIYKIGYVIIYFLDNSAYWVEMAYLGGLLKVLIYT